MIKNGFYALLLIISMPSFAEINITETLEPITRPGTKAAAYIAEDVTSYITKQNNYQIEAKSYNYNGYQVNFQHLHWKIQERSVCANYPKNTQEKSRCQVSAKQLFNEACSALNNKKNKSNIQYRSQNMYCNAATSFKPQIIQISQAKEQTELEKARSECNALIAEAMGNNDPRVAGRKEDACNKYKELRDNS